MHIATHPFHRAISYYWTRLFPEHTFHFVCDEQYLSGASDDMPMRPRLPNVVLEHELSSACTLAVSHTQSAWAFFSERLPTLHWFHHLPYEAAEIAPRPKVAVYLSPEAERLWGRGTQRVVARHPIDAGYWWGYRGEDPRALMVATMPLNWWGEKKGLGLFSHLVQRGIEYKLVGLNNETDWPQCDPEFVTDEGRMRELYRQCRVYGCTSPQIERAALEALAVGMPLVLPRHRFNTLTEDLEGVVQVTDSEDEMYTALALYQRGQAVQDQAKIIAQRRLLREHFAPLRVRQAWRDAFEKMEV